MLDGEHLRAGANKRSDDARCLQLLEADEGFQELDRYVPPLALLRTMGVSRDEVAHSRLLAALLDPRRHAGAEAMLRTLLREITGSPSLDVEISTRLWSIADVPWSRVAVHRERLFIDVVVEIASAEGNVVVGIENKLDAREQQEQIARYQRTLSRAYPDRIALMAFLTPTGREPTTAHIGGPVPALALGYDSVLAAVEETRRQAPRGSRDEGVLHEVVAHLKEDILGEIEIEGLVRELWRTHARALQLALKHRPQLSGIREAYVERLRQRYGEDATFSHWPKRGELSVIKMDLSSWFEKGFPFTFSLYADPEVGPRVRVLTRRENYEHQVHSLAEWARRVNASSEPLIDEDFTLLPGWGSSWRRILREEDYPPYTILEEQAYDEETVMAASDAVFRLVELLRPHVDNT